MEVGSSIESPNAETKVITFIPTEDIYKDSQYSQIEIINKNLMVGPIMENHEDLVDSERPYEEN